MADVADGDAGEEDGGFVLDAADVGGLEADDVGRAEEGDAFGEVQDKDGQEHKADGDKAADFPFDA
jgi:hypothetical protein